jgi:RNA polymerase sigma factor (sigma-70 family)
VARFDSTSWSLVFGAAAGSAADGESFARQYSPLIRRFLAARWRLPVEHDQVAEGCQEVLVQLFKPQGALAHLEEEGSDFRGFLYGVVRNVALMIERTERRRRRVVGHESCFDPEQVEDSEATLSQVFDLGWAQMLAGQALGRLSERLGKDRRDHYRCLEMRYLEGLPPREIATRLQRDVQQVYELLRTARNEFRSALLEVMAEYHPGCSPEELKAKCRDLTQLR